MFSNKLAAWAILAVFLASFVPTATAGGDDEITITWNWGDDTTDEGGTVTHTYDKVGTYTVTVCATDDDGGEDCQQATIPIELL